MSVVYSVHELFRYATVSLTLPHGPAWILISSLWMWMTRKPFCRYAPSQKYPTGWFTTSFTRHSSWIYFPEPAARASSSLGGGWMREGNRSDTELSDVWSMRNMRVTRLKNDEFWRQRKPRHLILQMSWTVALLSSVNYFGPQCSSKQGVWLVYFRCPFKNVVDNIIEFLGL